MNTLSYPVLTDRAIEMALCARVDPSNVDSYYTLHTTFKGEALLRVESFIHRHGLYRQMVEEDKLKENRSPWK